MDPNIRSTGKNEKFSNREERYPCLYPGMMRILFPEKSFVPINMAVRVANISSGGSLVEIHEANLESEYKTFEGCFFELKIATGDVPLMYGRVVRSDMAEESCMLGLKFHQSYPEVIGRLVHEEMLTEGAGNDPLPTPILNPFSPMSDEPQVLISGTAMEANEVVITNENDEEIRDPVTDHEYSAKLILKHEDFNEFKLVSTTGERNSNPIPVIIAFVPLSENDFHFHVDTTSDINGQHTLTMEYMGAPKAAGDMLTEFATLTPDGKHARFSLKLTSIEPFDPKTLKQIKKESERIRLNSVAEEE